MSLNFKRLRPMILDLVPNADVDNLIELLALLGDADTSQSPSGFESPASPAGRDAPLLVTNSPDGQIPIVKAARPNGSSFTFSIGDSGVSLVFTSPAGKDTNIRIAGGGGGAANVFPGTIIEYVSDNVYRMRIYDKSIDNPGTIVLVRQLEGDPAYPHKDGRWALVVKSGDKYYMQIPVWG